MAKSSVWCFWLFKEFIKDNPRAWRLTKYASLSSPTIMWLVVLVGCRKGDEKFRKLLKANFADFTIVASPAEVNVIRSGKCIGPKFYNYQGGLRRSWGHLVRDGRRILMEKNGRWLALYWQFSQGVTDTHMQKKEYLLTWLVLFVTGTHVVDRFSALLRNFQEQVGWGNWLHMSLEYLSLYICIQR